MTTAESWIFIDGHVHIHRHFNVSRLLDAAADNLERAAKRLNNCTEFVGVLLLAEMSGVDWFGRTRARAAGGDWQVGGWSLSLASEPETLIARWGRNCRTLFIISGRQIVTDEHIEVLALITRAQLLDGLPLHETIDACHAAGALVVLPWGAGKWFGRRGQLVRRALDRHSHVCPILAGDNGGRPWCWPRPRIFAAIESTGTAVLPGTDPLPIPDQATRVGSFGIALQGALPLDFPASALRRRLLETASRATTFPFGTPERPWRFVRDQIRLRLRSGVA